MVFTSPNNLRAVAYGDMIEGHKQVDALLLL